MLEGKFCRVRVMDSTDAEYVRQLRNSPLVSRYYVDRFFISDVQQKKFVEDLANDPIRKYFIGENIVTRQPFGVFSSLGIDWRHGRSAAGQFLDPAVPGHGIHAIEASFLLLDHGFRQFNHRKVTGEIIDGNRAALRYAEACGFFVEARLRKHIYFNGDYHDLLLTALYRDDFYHRPAPAIKFFLDNMPELPPPPMTNSAYCRPPEA